MTRQIPNKIWYQGQEYRFYDSLFTPEMVGLKPVSGFNTACYHGYFYEAEIIDTRLILINLAIVGTHLPQLGGCDAVTGEVLGTSVYKNLNIPIIATGQVIATLVPFDKQYTRFPTGKRRIFAFLDGIMIPENGPSIPKFGLLEWFRKFLNKNE